MKKQSLMKIMLVVGLLCVSLLGFGHAEEVEAVEVGTPQTIEEMTPAEEVLETKDDAPANEIPPEPKEENKPLEEQPRPTFTLVFLNDADEAILTEHLRLGGRILIPFFVPTKDGYVFEFWYDVQAAEGPGGVIEEYRFGAGIEMDTVLKPFYTEILAKEGDDAASEGEDILLPWGGPQTGTKGDAADEVGEDEDDGMSGEKGLAISIIDDPEDPGIEPEEAGKQMAAAASGPMNMAINIFSTHSVCMDEGSTINLWAELVGFEGTVTALQWQYYDGAWKDVEGATAVTHSFAANRETVNYGWRLVATVLDTEAEAA